VVEIKDAIYRGCQDFVYPARTRRGAAILELRAAPDVQLDLQGNSFVEALVKRTVRRGEGQPAVRRFSIGVLPAVMFEVGE